MSNLVLIRKAKGRSYVYTGQKFQAPWKIKDLDTNKIYEDYDEYVAETKPKVVAKKKAAKKKTAAKVEE